MVKKKVPLPVTDTTIAQEPHGIDAVIRLIGALQPIFLALIGVATVYYGNKASGAAEEARTRTEAVAVKVESTQARRDSQLKQIQSTSDSTHVLVNSAKTELERQNKALRDLLESRGIAVPEKDVSKERP